VTLEDRPTVKERESVVNADVKDVMVEMMMKKRLIGRIVNFMRELDLLGCSCKKTKKGRKKEDVEDESLVSLSERAWLARVFGCQKEKTRL
jgi:hypothetical protein